MELEDFSSPTAAGKRVIISLSLFFSLFFRDIVDLVIQDYLDHLSLEIPSIAHDLIFIYKKKKRNPT